MLQRAGPAPKTSAEWHARSGKDGEVTVHFEHTKVVPSEACSSDSDVGLSQEQPDERPAVPDWKDWWAVPGVTTAAVQATILENPLCVPCCLLCSHAGGML